MNYTDKAKIPLHGKYGDGKHATVSSKDLATLSRYRWYVTASGYVVTDTKERNSIRMHRLILGLSNLKRGAKWTECVDHINRDKLDNSRENIRVTSYAVNNHRKIHPVASKGAAKTRYGRWQSTIRFKGKTLNIGSFGTKQEAQNAYLKKSLELYGE